MGIRGAVRGVKIFYCVYKYFCVQVRVMRVEYDHYSKRCPSYSIPPVHPDDVPSLLEKVEKVSSSQNIS